MKFYGRKGEIGTLTEMLRLGGARIIVEGPSGIGKSALLASLQDSLPEDAQHFRILLPIRGPTFTQKSVFAGIASQLLVPLAQSTFNWDDARKVLREQSIEHSGQMIGALVMDGLTFAVGRNLQNTAKCLSGLLKDVYTKSQGKAIAQTLIAEQRQEILAGLFAIFDLVHKMGLKGTICLTSVENGGVTVQDCILEMFRSLPSGWNMLVGMNTETDEGLSCIQRFKSLRVRHVIERFPVQGVCVEVAQLIWKESHPTPLPIAEMITFHQTLQGRPRYLRDCCIENNPLAEVSSMKNNLADLYRGRLQRLSAEARSLVLKLAFIPVLQPFSFEVIHTVSGAVSALSTSEYIDQLKSAMLLENDSELAEHFVFSHKTVPACLREGVLSPAAAELALTANRSLESIQLSQEQRALAEVHLAIYGGPTGGISAIHVEVAQKLQSEGAYEASIIALTAIHKMGLFAVMGG